MLYHATVHISPIPNNNLTFGVKNKLKQYETGPHKVLCRGSVPTKSYSGKVISEEAAGATNHWTEVDWTGLDWTHKNVRNKFINHPKQNLSTRKIEHDGT